MQWLNDPKISNSIVSPQDNCVIHVCFTRDDPPGPGSCLIRFCLTRWCFINDGVSN